MLAGSILEVADWPKVSPQRWKFNNGVNFQRGQVSMLLRLVLLYFVIDFIEETVRKYDATIV